MRNGNAGDAKRSLNFRILHHARLLTSPKVAKLLCAGVPYKGKFFIVFKNVGMEVSNEILKYCFVSFNSPRLDFLKKIRKNTSFMFTGFKLIHKLPKC